MRYQILVILSACAALFGQTADEWPILHNINQTGFSPTTRLKPPLKVRWMTKVPGKFWCGPAVAEGKLVVKSEDGYIFCLDAETGQLDWRYLVGGFHGLSLLGSGLSILNGRVYAHIPHPWSSIGGMYCFDLKTGDLLWKKASGVSPLGYDNYQAHSPQKAGGRLFYASNADINRAQSPGPRNIRPQLQCWNAETGDSLWVYDIWDTLCTNVAMVVANDTVFVSVGHAIVNWMTDTGRTVALDTNGNVLWSSGHYYVTASPMGELQYEKGQLYIHRTHRVAYCDSVPVLNTADGALVQNYPNATWRALWAITDSFFYAREYGAPPRAIDRKTGMDALSFKLFPGDAFCSGCGSPVVGNGYAYCGFGNMYGDRSHQGGKMYAWDIHTGEAVWSYPNATNSCPPMAIAYDRLYALTGSDGLIYCFENAQ